MLTFAAGDDSNVGIGPCLECIASTAAPMEGDWQRLGIEMIVCADACHGICVAA